MTVNHWWTGYSLTAKQRKYRAAEKVLAAQKEAQCTRDIVALQSRNNPLQIWRLVGHPLHDDLSSRSGNAEIAPNF
jgi:hypothetical protein